MTGKHQAGQQTPHWDCKPSELCVGSSQLCHRTGTHNETYNVLCTVSEKHQTKLGGGGGGGGGHTVIRNLISK